MPFDTCPDLLVDESPPSRRFSAVLSGLAVVGLFGSLLIASPGRFSNEHRADHSPLRWVVDALSLYGKWPTPEGKEVRLVIFNLAAGAMLLVAGLRMLTQNSQPRMAMDDLIDFRARAASPVTWAMFFLFCSILSSSFAESRRLTLGQSAIHGFQVAWLLPLALLLEPAHARRLARFMVWLLTGVALLGLWYYAVRRYPHSGLATRLAYPFASELRMAACLLPMPFVAMGLLLGLPGSKPKRRLFLLLALIPVLCALALTVSRSAAVGGFFGAAAVATLLTRGRVRGLVIAAAIAIAAGGAYWVAGERNKLDSKLRGHSIRARVDHAWPYALALSRIKPILGHGDGAYGLLAGQLARDDQIDDPRVMSFGDDQRQYWLAHADSEPLQLLAEVGIVGLLAAAAALIATLVAAVRFCDAPREPREHHPDRGLVIGLTAALIAIAAEECTSNGLRTDGLPSVFLTTGALLWTLIRRHRPPREVAPSDQWMSAGVLRMTGLGATGVALALIVAAGLDGSATRSCYRAEAALVSGRNDEAVFEADLGTRRSLNVQQQLNARLAAISAMSQEFDNRLKSSKPPGEADLAIASAALARLAALQFDAPRYLRTAALRVELFTNLARACERRGEPANAADFAIKRNEALAALIADEPFRLEAVQALLRADPAVPIQHRMAWLRQLIRAGEMQPAFVELFVAQANTPNFIEYLNDLTHHALNDATRAPEAWKDRHSPETLRLKALMLDLQGQPGEAIPIVAKAVAMYDRAGTRLFATNSAARHEEVRLRFAADPIADVDARLRELAKAAQIAESRVTPSDPLPNPMGATRFSILLAAGRESEASAQAQLLFPSTPISDALATGYLSIASGFAQARRDSAIYWADRACELSPGRSEAHALVLSLLLTAGREDDAAARLRKATENMQAEALARLVKDLKSQFPQSRIWDNTVDSREQESDKRP